MMIRIEKDTNHIAVLTMDLPDRSTNLVDANLMESLEKAVTCLEERQELRGVILTSAKKDFIAGADLDMLFAAHDTTELVNMSLAFKATMRRLERLGKPVVAAINGTVLGGGYEIALACHHRVALNNPKSRIGFPEVTLGLFPGGGGTQRLPRLIGLQKAFPIIMEGKRYAMEQALAEGLIDELAEDREDLMARARAWIEANPEAAQPWDRTHFKWPGGNPKGPSMLPVWAVAPSLLNKKTRGNYPAPRNALAAMYEGSQVDFDTADRIETRYFAQTVVSRAAKNMISAFWYQLNRIKRGGSRPEGYPPSTFARVGILGAGMMGAGIAYVLARAGLEVVLRDVSLELAEKGRTYSAELLQNKIKKGRMTSEQRDRILQKIQPTADVDDLKGCDLIIEAVFEDRELKARVIREAEARIDDSAVFASNTSTLPITGLAGKASRPRNFIGLHFFSPVDKMALVEIIVGKQTSDRTLARAFDFVLQIRKTPIVVNDSRGFYTSRVFSTFVLEGIALLNEGQHPRAVESAGLAAGMPVGPLALSDEVSLSLMHQVKTQTAKDMERAGQPVKQHPADGVINRMVEVLDRPGKKKGRGFYQYPDGGQKHLWPGLAREFPPAGAELDQKEMIERMMFIQCLETVRCLEEGVLTSVADANIGSILGWGFAPFKGGTLQYINDYGPGAFVARARELAGRYGDRFAPPRLLLQMLEKGGTFSI